MPVKSSVRRSAIARPAAVPSTPSAKGGRERSCFGGSSSGRTTDSDSVYLGSNPSPPAKNQGPPQGGPFSLRSNRGNTEGPMRRSGFTPTSSQKKDRVNIDANELEGFRKLAKAYDAFTDGQISKLLAGFRAAMGRPPLADYACVIRLLYKGAPAK